MRQALIIFFMFITMPCQAEQARFEQTPYKDPKALFEFYFDSPQKINTALYWLRSYINPLTEQPYNFAPEFIDIKVIIHGTEIVTLAKHNYAKYKEAVERMRYYHQLGVEFRVCGIAASDFGYSAKDFQDFVIITPSAIAELAHWQNQGYALVTPRVLPKIHSIDEIR